MNPLIHTKRAETRLRTIMAHVDEYRMFVPADDRSKDYELHEMYKVADRAAVKVLRCRKGDVPPPEGTPITASRKDKTWNGTAHTCCGSPTGWRHLAACSYNGDGKLPPDTVTGS